MSLILSTIGGSGRIEASEVETMRYARCTGCGRWVLRDEMLGINTDLYDAENRREVVRQRYCPPCAADERARLLDRQWDHMVVRSEALAPLPDGCFPSNEVIWERERQLREAQNREFVEDDAQAEARATIDGDVHVYTGEVQP